MTDNELQQVKERTLYKNELKELKNQILDLEQNPKVKEYIKLTGDFNEKSKKDTSIIISKNESNILLFNYELFSVIIDGYHMSVFIYRDLETTEYFYQIARYAYKKINRFYITDDKQEFEKKNREFEELRECFFEQLLNKSQEQVVGEILESNKQLILGRKNELLF